MTEFDMGALLQQAQAVKERMEYLQKGLEEQRVEGSAGAGMVRAELTGTQRLVSVRIDPSVMGEDIEMVQDLIVAAVNQGLEKSKALAQEKMGSLMPPGAMPPGFPGL